MKSGFDKVAGTLNEKIGESGPVKVHLSDLVSEVFKKHTMEETEEFSLPEQRKQHRKNQKSQRPWPKPWRIPEYFCFWPLPVLFCILF